jgi:hypothetical protein
MTAMIAATENRLFSAAHSISANTMSSSAMGAFMMLSQVFCTCMREKAEYSDSKVAASAQLTAMLPEAR